MPWLQGRLILTPWTSTGISTADLIRLNNGLSLIKKSHRRGDILSLNRSCEPMGFDNSLIVCAHAKHTGIQLVIW